MAGLILFLGEQNPARAEAAARRLKFFDEETRIIADAGFSAAWVGHDDARLFAPAFDPKTGVRVFTSGRVAWDEPDWKRAEELQQFEGGLSNRLLLQCYLQGGAGALTRHNGAAALFVWDARQKILHLWTDHFGYHPVYLYRPENLDSAVISTFADAIADDPGVSVTCDPVALAEFLSAWRVTPPHTYYREIKFAGAATHLTWDFSKRTFRREEYWKPYQQDPFPNMNAAAEELAVAVSEAVRIRTLPRLGPIISYTSGGMDSRAVLFAAASRKDVIGVNLYDVPNKEAAISRRLCEAAGVRYVGFGRDDDYYPRWLAEGARLSGAMWSAEDNHFLGTRELVRQSGARTVVTACTTDWLFKGYGLEKTYARFLGRNLPIKVFTHERVNGFLPNTPRAVPARFKAEVDARLEEWFAGTPRQLKTDADWLAVEDRRIRPACYTPSVSGQIMYRMFPYDTFLADARVADCYARCRAEWKINSDLWGKAVNRICAGATDIEDANFGWRIGSSTPAKLAAFAAGWIGRRIRPPKLAQNGLANEGSWPNLWWYTKHSPTLKQLWSDTPAETRAQLSEAWGSNLWNTPLESWSSAPNDLFRVLTLATHLNRR
jgi:asparagine synthase (glutamine-hydrolysing)